MHFVPVLIVLSVAVGLTVFALDFYRNRHRLSQPSQEPRVDTDLHGLETVSLDTRDLHGLAEGGDQAIHAVGETLGKLIEGFSQHHP
jgi:hypothetical protein